MDQGLMGLEALFQPITIGTLTLPNRFVMAPMSRYACPERMPTADLSAYHRRRAEGGVGLMLTGGAAIDHPAANNSPVLADFRAEARPAWQALVDETRAAGGRIGLQLWHAGGRFNREPWWQPAPLASPSGLGGPDFVVGEPLSDEAINDIIAGFGEAAAAARQIGFDAVEIHAAHGFLLDQFFWDVTNRRPDRWGGLHLEDRLTFALAVYHAVRAAVGPGMPVSMRISQWKEQDYGARLAATPDALARWVGPLVDAGIDVIDCSQRRFWEPEFAGSDLNLAGWVKKLTGGRTMTIGSIGLDRDVTASFAGDRALPAPLTGLVERFERGDFDLVGLGRVLLADPDWIEKTRDGRLSELIPFEKDTADVVW
jgi:2,4-dienoyl-CoA reductase-like NADH-dependent reductase (Old Yellow Enzyme family)